MNHTLMRIAASLAFSLAACGAAFAQYTPVTHASGVVPVLGVNTNVTPAGLTGISVACGPNASPYEVGAGSFEFDFSAPVGAVQVPIVFAAGDVAQAHIEVNGAPYALTTANVVGTVPTATCGPGAAGISGGDVTNAGDTIDNASAMIVIPGPVSSIRVSNVASGYIFFGVQVAPMTYFRVTNTTGVATVNGIGVTVTGSGNVSSGQFCGPVAAPFILNRNPGHYNYSFSPNVDSMVVPLVFIDAGVAGALEITVNNNDVSGAAALVGPGPDTCAAGSPAGLDDFYGRISSPGDNLSHSALSAYPGPIATAAFFTAANTILHGMYISAGGRSALSFGATTLQIPANSSGDNAFIDGDLLTNAANSGMQVSWSILVPPTHGTLGGFPATATANGSIVTPSNTSYTPDANYIGPDTFTMLVSDGLNSVVARLDVSVNPSDSTPDAFAFTPYKYLATFRQVISDPITISGIDMGAPISITGGFYSQNNADFTTQPGTVFNGDTIVVLAFASPTPATTTHAVVTIGGVSGSFDTTTAPGNNKVLQDSGTSQVNGIAVTATGAGTASTSGGFCGTIAGPYSLPDSAGGYSFTFGTPVASVAIPVAFLSAGVAGDVHIDVNGVPYTLTASNIAGLVDDASVCSRVAANVAGGELVNSDNLHNFPTAMVVIPGPITSIAVSNLSVAAVQFGLYVNRGTSLDFDSSGTGDLLWQNADGRAAIWLMNGAAPSAQQEIIGAATGWSVSHVADFDGDGKSDLVWQNTDGRVAIYLMNGTTPSLTTQILNAGPWTVVHTPDLDGDGKADLVLQNADGSAAVWLMNGATMTSGVSIIGPGTGWTVTHIGDFNGDGKTDLLWTNADGRVAIWLMNGTTVISSTKILNAGSGWSVAQVADLDGDGKADIVWHHTDGSIAVWLMNGATMTSSSGILGPGTGWSVAGTADFDADGKADLFFGNTDGRAAIWLMNGITPTTQTQILNAGGGWTMARLLDLDGDGKADIVWQHTDGRVAVWLMNGTTMSSGSEILPAGTGWSVSTASQ